MPWIHFPGPDAKRFAKKVSSPTRAAALTPPSIFQGTKTGTALSVCIISASHPSAGCCSHAASERPLRAREHFPFYLCVLRGNLPLIVSHFPRASSSQDAEGTTERSALTHTHPNWVDLTCTQATHQEASFHCYYEQGPKSWVLPFLTSTTDPHYFICMSVIWCWGTNPASPKAPPPSEKSDIVKFII